MLPLGEITSRGQSGRSLLQEKLLHKNESLYSPLLAVVWGGRDGTMLLVVSQIGDYPAGEMTDIACCSRLLQIWGLEVCPTAPSALPTALGTRLEKQLIFAPYPLPRLGVLCWGVGGWVFPTAPQTVSREVHMLLERCGHRGVGSGRLSRNLVPGIPHLWNHCPYCPFGARNQGRGSSSHWTSKRTGFKCHPQCPAGWHM